MSLPARQVDMKDGKPSISFSTAEVSAGAKRFQFSLVAKFTVGRHSISEIHKAFQANWTLTGRATISGIWDARHILIILDSEIDARTALSSPLRKVNQSMFRLFRWTPDYNPKTESTITTAWIRLNGLPLPLYDSAFFEAIVSTFGTFVGADDRTKACLSVKYARVCVELDVSKTIPDAVWINLPDNAGYWQVIEVETKLDYCSKCKVHGHTLSNCRKNGARPRPNNPQVFADSQPVCGDKKVIGDGDTSKEEEVSKMKETNTVEVVHSMASQDHLAMVVFNEHVEAGPMINNTTPVPGTPKSGAMVIYEDVADSSTILPQVDPEEDSITKMVHRDFHILKNELAAEGVFAIPEILDEDFRLKWNKAANKYAEDSDIPESDFGNATSSASEWIPSSKKKKKKGKNPPPLDVRRSSRAKQTIEVKNPDFIYHSKGV